MGIHREHFQSVITTDIQRDILRNVYSGYLRAHKLVKNQEHQPGPAQNLYPYMRYLQRGSRGLAACAKIQCGPGGQRPRHEIQYRMPLAIAEYSE